jgi:hypothetical protein
MLKSARTAAVKADSFRRAIWSLIWHGRVTVQTYTLRRAECMDCEKRVDAPKGTYCGACGCPQWFMSRLEMKWRIRDVGCPLGRW